MLRIASLAEVQDVQVNQAHDEDDLKFKPNFDALLEDKQDDEETQKAKPDKTEVYKPKKVNAMMYNEPGKKEKRHDEFLKNKLSKSDYIQMLREDDDRNETPQEIFQSGRSTKKTEFAREAQKLEAVEEMTMSRMNMNKKQRKLYMQMQTKSLKDDTMDLANMDEFKQLEKMVDYRQRAKNEAQQEEPAPFVKRRDKKFKSKFNQ